MAAFSQLLNSDSAAWFFAPTAVLLGALHGLEPGHSKTMTAAFIIAIRGTFGQALLLALSATASHTAVIWVLAFLALTWGRNIDVEATNPYFQILSGTLILGLAIWMLLRLRRSGQRPMFNPIGEPCDDHSHSHSPHPHDPPHTLAGIAPHARAHADHLARRLPTGRVSTAQVILFGISGGLVPCAAAVTVLLLCLQTQRFWLGLALVFCFSVGLAFTLTVSGALAAWGARHAVKRWPALAALASRAPYAGNIVLLALGLCMAVRGLAAL
jgi:ABC-type nickel/cobalt efflux system permease component RcnA